MLKVLSVAFRQRERDRETWQWNICDFSLIGKSSTFMWDNPWVRLPENMNVTMIRLKCLVSSKLRLKDCFFFG